MCKCHALWNQSAFPLGQFVRSFEVGCPNECSHLHGLWGSGYITGQGSSPNLSCYIPGFQQSTAVSQCKFHNFTWSSQFVHPSSERNKLPFVPCSVQGDSHLSMFRKNWQQPDLHKPGDRVAFSGVFKRVYTFLVSHNSLGNHFSLQSIIVVLVAVYIVVSASEGNVHIVAGVLWCFDTESPQKKTVEEGPGQTDRKLQPWTCRIWHLTFVKICIYVHFKQKSLPKTSYLNINQIYF